MWHHHTTFHTTTTSATAPQPVQYPHSTTRRGKHNYKVPVTELHRSNCAAKPLAIFLSNTHTTSPHHSNHTTIVVCWQLWCGKVVVVRGVMWLLATFPPQPRPPQRTTTSPGNHEHTPPPAGEAHLQGPPVIKLLKLCCRTSGDFFGLSKSTEEEGSLRFLSFNPSSHQHATPPHHTTVLESLVRAGCW